MSQNSKSLSHAATVMQTTDLTKSMKFYTDVLGFKVTFTWEEPPSYAILKAGDSVQIHLAVIDSSTALLNPRAIYIFCHDIHLYYDNCRTNGLLDKVGIQKTEYGMEEFEVRDPDGNLLCFGQG